MELTGVLAALAVVLPLAYGAPLEAAATLHPEVLAAMKRDLGLDAREATARVAWERKAGDVISQLRESMGDSFAGAWVENGKTIHVGVTDESKVSQVKAAGASATVVSNSLNKLQEAKKALDKIVKEQPQTFKASTKSDQSGIASFYVDVQANKLILKALSDSTTDAEKLAKEVGLSESEFEVVTVKQMPKPFIVGGDAYIIDNAARCSVGFAVQGGFVSAGHCGGPGASITYTDGGALGTMARSDFPGNDMSFIETVGGTDLPPTVGTWGAGDQTILGSSVSPSGSAVCRSGSTTGYQCGTIGSFDVTLNYAEGSVSGLTGTTACAEGGDSGGSFFSGDQAQGVTSGGSGDCSGGGETYFQPLNEILSNYGLSLITG
ncbi:alpha-lytic protease prodomain-containing protein [Sarocladium implicatum]|nr:alpha-lytic protease prodomain-containing protein [Sarocladium implicatum]